MNKEDLKALFARAGKIEKITVAGVEMEIVELSFGQRLSLADHGDDGMALIRHALALSCYKPGTVERLLDDELIDLLPQAEAMRVFEAVKRINGIGVKPALEPDPDVEASISEPTEAEKNG